MNTRRFLVLSILVAGVLLIGAKGHTSGLNPGSGPANQSEFSTVPLQPVGSGHFYFGFHFGGPHHYGYGYHGHHHRHDYGHRRYGHGRYYGRYPHWYKGRGYRYKHHYGHRPYPPYYRHPYYW